MGGNGSKMRGNLDNSATREFKEVFFISNNIKVVQLKDNKKRVRLPEESNTPNRIYVIFNKDGTLKSIGKYGSDCLKKFEIHFDHKHDGLQPHYHKWINKGENARGPMTSGNGKHSKTVAHAPTKRMIELINKIIRTMTEQETTADYIGYDLGGYLYNKKYPPNQAAYGTRYGGYPTDNQEAFFYDLAINLYGLKFTYNGRMYRIPSDGDGWILIRDDNGMSSDTYDNPIELIENAEIEGKRLLEIIDDIRDISLQ